MRRLLNNRPYDLEQDGVEVYIEARNNKEAYYLEVGTNDLTPAPVLKMKQSNDEISFVDRLSNRVNAQSNVSEDPQDAVDDTYCAPDRYFLDTYNVKIYVTCVSPGVALVCDILPKKPDPNDPNDPNAYVETDYDNLRNEYPNEPAIRTTKPGVEYENSICNSYDISTTPTGLTDVTPAPTNTAGNRKDVVDSGEAVNDVNDLSDLVRKNNSSCDYDQDLVNSTENYTTCVKCVSEPDIVGGVRQPNTLQTGVAEVLESNDPDVLANTLYCNGQCGSNTASICADVFGGVNDPNKSAKESTAYGMRDGKKCTLQIFADNGPFLDELPNGSDNPCYISNTVYTKQPGQTGNPVAPSTAQSTTQPTTVANPNPNQATTETQAPTQAQTQAPATGGTGEQPDFGIFDNSTYDECLPYNSVDDQGNETQESSPIDVFDSNGTLVQYCPSQSEGIIENNFGDVDSIEPDKVKSIKSINWVSHLCNVNTNYPGVLHVATDHPDPNISSTFPGGNIGDAFYSSIRTGYKCNGSCEPFNVQQVPNSNSSNSNIEVITSNIGLCMPARAAAPQTGVAAPNSKTLDQGVLDETIFGGGCTYSAIKLADDTIYCVDDRGLVENPPTPIKEEDVVTGPAPTGSPNVSGTVFRIEDPSSREFPVESLCSVDPQYPGVFDVSSRISVLDPHYRGAPNSNSEIYPDINDSSAKVGEFHNDTRQTTVRNSCSSGYCIPFDESTDNKSIDGENVELRTDNIGVCMECSQNAGFKHTLQRGELNYCYDYRCAGMTINIPDPSKNLNVQYCLHSDATFSGVSDQPIALNPNAASFNNTDIQKALCTPTPGFNGVLDVTSNLTLQSSQSSNGGDLVYPSGSGAGSTVNPDQVLGVANNVSCPSSSQCIPFEEKIGEYDPLGSQNSIRPRGEPAVLRTTNIGVCVQNQNSSPGAMSNPDSTDIGFSLFSSASAQGSQEEFSSNVTRSGSKNVRAKTGDELPAGSYDLSNGVTLNFTSPKKIHFFDDKNGNFIQDAGEEYVENIDYDLVKTSESFNYNFNTGWNSMNIPVFKDENNFYKASDIVGLGNGVGLQVETIKKWEGKWLEYNVEGGVEYGEDFPIYPNQGYFIKVGNSGELNLFGSVPTVSYPTSFNSGWNLVGIAGGYDENLNQSFTNSEFVDGDFTAADFLSVLNMSYGEGVFDNITRWDDGVYRSLNLQEDKEFGLDFDIIDIEAYFVRTEKKTVFTP